MVLYLDELTIGQLKLIEPKPAGVGLIRFDGQLSSVDHAA
jgi:hypothetical protein